IFDEGKFSVFKIDARSGHEYSTETVDTNLTGDFSGAGGDHGGGDMRLTADFVRLIRGEPTSASCTHLDDSLAGHLVSFLAEKSRVEGCVLPVRIPVV
ncbi:MAG: gfo/Idh/MocA family oxidoreductase, partial [Kiritimatiellia bacterium]|nr:gfo/Idh/MocA family oxidoreductase [Kiritimatiellia bacterium]